MNRQLVFAALLGAVTVFGFAPLELFPLPLLTLALLFLLWRRAASAHETAWLGFAWGLGFFLAGVSWVYVSMHDVGGMPMPIAALATVALCALLALFPAFAGFAFGRLRNRQTWRDALLAASLWALVEWLRGWVASGFPWLSMGYSQSPPSPLAGFAPLLGVYGIGLIVALLAALPVFCRRLPVVAAVIAAIVGGGQLLRTIEWTQPVGPPLTVSLLQGNIPQSLKWDPALLRLSLDTYIQLTNDYPAALTVLPETALPLLLSDVPAELLRQLTAHGPVILGIPAQGAGGFVNAAVAIASPLNGAPQFYAKSHLVPFGEYVPPGFNWFLDLMNMPMSDFSAGLPAQQPFVIAGQKIAPNICYEDLFGEEIRRALPEATLLINLSNTAWFGHSLAQPQHLQIARMRAMESGRTMLRATNTGMTAMVRPDGSVAAVLPAFTTAALTVEAQGYTGLTPYGRWGNWPTVMIDCMILVAAAIGRRRDTRANAKTR
jgi:apolipoprotein N-acyltransferase